MAITITETVGSASATSYVTEQEFQTYAEQRVSSVAVDRADGDQRRRAMVSAFRRLNQCLWVGERVSATQAGAWPRVGAPKPDPVGVLNAGYGAGWVGRDVYLTTEIPQAVKDAQCELACAYLDGFDEYGDRITRASQDGMSYEKQFARPVNGLPGAVMRLIGPLLDGPRLVRG